MLCYFLLIIISDKHTKTHRSHGKKFHVSVEEEVTKLLTNGVRGRKSFETGFKKGDCLSKNAQRGTFKL
ncbi:unnamed protein product [Lathyrus oleraceus]